MTLCCTPCGHPAVCVTSRNDPVARVPWEGGSAASEQIPELRNCKFQGRVLKSDFMVVVIYSYGVEVWKGMCR